MRASASLLLLSFARGIAAHEHHDDKIPEGGAVSPDPIVSLLANIHLSTFTNFYAGFNALDPHTHTDIGFWSHFPHGDGPRSELFPPHRKLFCSIYD